MKEKIRTTLTLPELMEVSIKQGLQIELTLSPVSEHNRNQQGDIQHEVSGVEMVVNVGSQIYKFEPTNRNYKDEINAANVEKMQSALIAFAKIGNKAIVDINSEFSPELKAKLQKISEENMQAPRMQLRGHMIENRARPKFDDSDDDACPSCGHND